jgi:hypothetical protein
MGTVRGWAARRGFGYVELPDAQFLAAVPPWFRDNARGSIQAVTDLARVEAALRSLEGGAACAVWVDADVVVFDPCRFDLPSCERAAFTREVWLDPTGGAPRCVERVNNAVLVARDRAFLLGYRAACLRIGRGGPLDKAAVGTRYLTELYRCCPMPLVRHVGNFSPAVSHAILRGDRPLLDAYRAALREPLFAANLCASYANVDYFGTVLGPDDYTRLVTVLLDTAGAALGP